MASYLVRIFTHGRRGAGTTASVRIFRMTGTEGTSGPSPWLREGFPAGSIVTTQIATDKHLGQLKELEIGHDGVGDAGTGWLLSGVTVKHETNANAPEVWFPYGRWLGEADVQDDKSGPERVILAPFDPSKAKAHSSMTDPATAHLNMIRHGDEPDGSNATPAMVPLQAIQAAAFAIPESSKLKQGKRGKISKSEGWAGEDAYFITKNGALFGVADGVSQWRESGVDAGLFARALTKGAAMAGTLQAAADQAKKENIQGSATMTICNIDLPKAKCRSQVLGDAQVAVVRDGKVAERTVEQEHSFGVPFQLSSCEGRDQPKDCLVYEWDLRPNDYIITGTDGLFDNLGDDTIAKIVSDPASPTLFNKAIALCQAAFDVSQTRLGETPYSRAANEALNLAFSGGKKDDITAIVAQVK